MESDYPKIRFIEFPFDETKNELQGIDDVFNYSELLLKSIEFYEKEEVHKQHRLLRALKYTSLID